MVRQAVSARNQFYDKRTGTETLSEQGNALFEEYEALSLDMATLSQAEAFEIGFCLGARLLCDVMSKEFTPSER